MSTRKIYLALVAGTLGAGAGVAHAEGFGPGNMFLPPVGSTQSFCPSGKIGFADLNGDRFDDVYCQNSDGSVSVITNWVGNTDLDKPSTQDYLHAIVPAGFCPAGATLGAADLNGDGMSDLYCHQLVEPFNTTVAFAGKSSAAGYAWFQQPVTWLSHWCAQDLIVARVDNNASDDLVCFDPNFIGGTVWIAASGSSPNTALPPTNNLCGGGKLATADLLGRNQSDLWCHNTTTGNLTVALAPSTTGAGYGAAQTWGTGLCTGQPATSFGVNRINGDLRADAWCWDANHNITVATNTGSGMSTPGTLKTSWCSDFTSPTLIPGDHDFNGDGQFDLGCREPSTGRIHVALSDPGVTFLDNGDTWTHNFEPFCTGSKQTLYAANLSGHRLPIDVGKRADLGCLDTGAQTFTVAASLSTGEVLGTNPVMAGNLNIYLDFYGNFTPLQQQGIIDLINGSSNTSYSAILTSYGTPQGAPTGVYHVQKYVVDPWPDSIDTNITLASVGGFKTVLEGHWKDGSLPQDKNAVYILIGDHTMPTEDDGHACGHHEWDILPALASPVPVALISGNTINPYWNNGNGGGCGYFQDKWAPHVGNPPNGDLFLDNSASIIMHELYEAITNPFGGTNQTWNSPYLEWQEVADMCGAHYGSSLTIDTTDVAYNVSFPSVNRRFLVQEMWYNITPNLGVCGISPPRPPIMHF